MSIIIDRALLESFLIPCAISIPLEAAVMSFFLIKKYHTNYALLLIFYLTLANLILSIGFMISAQRLEPTFTFPEKSSSFSCVLQETILVNIGQLSTAIWSAIISFILLRSFQTADVRTPWQLTTFMLLGFVLPTLMTIIIFAFNQNGDGGYFCWIKIGLTLAENTVMAMVEFTVPTLLCILYSLYAVVRAFMKMKELEQKSSGVRRLLLYPIIGIICWIFRFVARIQYILYSNVSTWVGYAGLITLAMQGIITSAVYASNMKIFSCRRDQLELTTQSKEVELMNVNSQDSSRTRSNSNPVNNMEERQRYRSYSNIYH